MKIDHSLDVIIVLSGIPGYISFRFLKFPNTSYTVSSSATDIFLKACCPFLLARTMIFPNHIETEASPGSSVKIKTI
jgi:hypothetical protein